MMQRWLAATCCLRTRPALLLRSVQRPTVVHGTSAAAGIRLRSTRSRPTCSAGKAKDAVIGGRPISGQEVERQARLRTAVERGGTRAERSGPSLSLTSTIFGPLGLGLSLLRDASPVAAVSQSGREGRTRTTGRIWEVRGALWWESRPGQTCRARFSKMDYRASKLDPVKPALQEEEASRPPEHPDDPARSIYPPGNRPKSKQRAGNRRSSTTNAPFLSAFTTVQNRKEHGGA